MTITTYPIGWCFTCDTNTCEHLSLTNKRLMDTMLEYASEMHQQKRANQVKLKGLTGEPWK